MAALFRHRRKCRRPRRPPASNPGGFGIFVALRIGMGPRFGAVCSDDFFPATSNAWRQLRQGDCPGCPHDIIDPRNLKFVSNVCGYSFRPEDDGLPTANGSASPATDTPSLKFSLILGSAGRLYGMARHRDSSVFLAMPLIVVLILWLFVVSFFRDPARTIPTIPTPSSAPPTARSPTSRRSTNRTSRRPRLAHQHFFVDLQRPRQPRTACRPGHGSSLFPRRIPGRPPRRMSACETSNCGSISRTGPRAGRSV